jgi:hypothetical protein
MYEIMHTSPIGLTSFHIDVHPYVGWVVKGARKSMEPEYIRVRVNKILINRRFRLNRMIDQKERKPPEVSDDQWNRLVRKRATEESKLTTEKMRKVAKGKGSNSKTQMASLREAAVVKLVLVCHFVTPDSYSL